MSSAAVVAQRSPDAAATSPGYQGDEGATQQPTADRPASAELAPSSEPAKATEAGEASTSAAAEPASDVDAGAAKGGEEDATPPQQVGPLHSNMKLERNVFVFGPSFITPRKRIYVILGAEIGSLSRTTSFSQNSQWLFISLPGRPPLPPHTNRGIEVARQPALRCTVHPP